MKNLDKIIHTAELVLQDGPKKPGKYAMPDWVRRKLANADYLARLVVDLKPNKQFVIMTYVYGQGETGCYLFWRAKPLYLKKHFTKVYWTADIEKAAKYKSKDEALRTAAHGADDEKPEDFESPKVVEMENAISLIKGKVKTI